MGIYYVVKGNANIPDEKKFFLEVVFPLDSKVGTKLMFFNSSFSVGKVLDLVADAGGIENKNNQSKSEVINKKYIK